MIARGQARSQSTVRRRTDAFWRFWISRRRRATPAGRVRCWRWRCQMSTFNMFGAFCASNAPEFAAKAADVGGLYIAPPAKANVLCVDEKPSIQALERAQGYLKL